MYRVLLAVAVVATLAGQSAAYPDTFSIDAESASAGDYGADSILGPGPVVHVLGGNIGLQQGDDLNALSSGLDTGAVIYFSVDPRLEGLPMGSSWYDVYDQAGKGHAAGDTFVTCNANGTAVSPMVGTRLNIQFGNQSYFGLLPLVPAGAVNTGGQDNLDAFNFDEFDLAPTLITQGDSVPDRVTYFSLSAGSASLGGALSADDIFMFDPTSPTGPLGGKSVAFADGAAIGLVDGDDLDALVLSDWLEHGELNIGSDSAFFSLAPGSPSLGTQYSAADIFYTAFEGTFQLFAGAEQLGLLATDNVDALEVQPGVVPEPGTVALLSMGLLGLLAYRRRQ